MSPTPLFLICLALISGCTLALPELSPARFLFGVRVGKPFRKTGEGRQALKIYYTHDIVGLLITVGVAAALGLTHIAAWYVAALLPEIFAGIGYVRARRRLLPFAAPAEALPVREAGLSVEEDRLPRWTWLGLAAFAFPVAGAAWVAAHWSQIPARIATHYGGDGQPNGWTSRTPLHLYGFFIFTTGLLLLLFLLGTVAYRGARRSQGRRTTLGIMISMMYLMGLLFSGAGVWVAHHFPVWILIAMVPVFLVAILLSNYKSVSKPEPPADTTPDECWSTGDVYNNPNDPALFVPKRMGYGYTLNFGNPTAKWFAASFLLGIGLLIAFLFWMQR